MTDVLEVVLGQGVVLEQRRLVARQGQQGMALAFGEDVTSGHAMSSLLNKSLFWTTMA